MKFLPGFGFKQDILHLVVIIFSWITFFFCVRWIYQTFPSFFMLGRVYNIIFPMMFGFWIYDILDLIIINFVTDWITSDIKAAASILYSFYSDNLTVSLTWALLPFFKLSGPYNHNSLFVKTSLNILQDSRLVGFSFALTCSIFNVVMKLASQWLYSSETVKTPCCDLSPNRNPSYFFNSLCSSNESWPLISWKFDSCFNKRAREE